MIVEEKEEIEIEVLEEDIKLVYPELEDLVIEPTTVEQHFKSQKYGYDNVTVKAIETEELQITPSAEEQINEGLYSKVTVAGDSNFTEENIREGIEMFGKIGTAEVRGKQNAVINTSTYISTLDIKTLIEEIPVINTAKTNAMLSMFNGWTKLKTIPLLDTSAATDMYRMFYGCTNLETISPIDTTNVLRMTEMFYKCTNLKSVPLLNTGKVTNMQKMFNYCSNLTEVPLFDTSSVTNMEGMLAACTNLKSVPLFNTSKVTTMQSMFTGCTNLTELPQFDTSSVTTFYFFCGNDSKLKTVEQLDAGKVVNIDSMFTGCSQLENLGGLANLGKAYTKTTANNSAYTLNLSAATKLTHESLMNIINNLYNLNLTYNVANGGTLYRQKLNLGSTNLAKLTDDEIAIATNKGWNVT